MRLIIEARLEGSETGTPGSEARVVAVIERQDHSVADLGLTLAEGRALLAKVQAGLVVHQTAEWTANQAACASCGAMLAHKDRRTIIMRTVFGKIALPSPRWLACRCDSKHGEPRRSRSPMATALPRRATPELEYLQAKWAAHLSYRQAVELLCEVLPLEEALSLGGIRRGLIDAGRAIDAEIERTLPQPAWDPRQRSTARYANRPALAASAWILRGCISAAARGAARPHATGPI